MSQNWPAWQLAFLERQQLPDSYLAHAHNWFDVAAEQVALHHAGAGRPLLVAVNGCQGSGKSTLCDYLRCALSAQHRLQAVALSLDDFYLTREEREQLGQQVHPLFRTRGVPGTHDMALLHQTLEDLIGSPRRVHIPRFDKAVDDRMPRSSWSVVEAPVDVVLLEGWCMGTRAQPEAALQAPVNALEEKEDVEGRWRAQVNRVLRQDFHPLYEKVDLWLMLRAPSFDCVYRWRLEQERKLAARRAGGAGLMDESALQRFVQHYQRLTCHTLEDLPRRCHLLYGLDPERRIAYRRWRPPTSERLQP